MTTSKIALPTAFHPSLTTVIQKSSIDQRYCRCCYSGSGVLADCLKNDPAEWSCPSCTFFNPATALRSCQMCQAWLPSASKSAVKYCASMTLPDDESQVSCAWSGQGSIYSAEMADERLEAQYMLVECIRGTITRSDSESIASEAAIRALVRCITADACPSVKQAASRALAAIGQPAVSYLLKLLEWDQHTHNKPSNEQQVVIRIAIVTLERMTACYEIQYPFHQVHQCLCVFKCGLSASGVSSFRDWVPSKLYRYAIGHRGLK
jgi:hypothetical protein